MIDWSEHGHPSRHALSEGLQLSIQVHVHGPPTKEEHDIIGTSRDDVFMVWGLLHDVSDVNSKGV